MRSFFFSLTAAISTFVCPLIAESPTLLKTYFQKAHIGDFIVTDQGKTNSLLFIRSLTLDTLILEEITLPDGFIDSKTMSWQSWIDAKAPGHTSWTLYEINLETGKLIECYSHSKKGWLVLDESQQFLAKLLFLSLKKIPDRERHKIGPQPQAGEPDQRAVWNPPLIIAGKKISKPQFEVWQGIWPSDGTLLANCHIELFFNKNTPLFPFPHWIEIKSSHYNFKLHTIDSGSHLHSVISGPVPRRPSQK